MNFSIASYKKTCVYSFVNNLNITGGLDARLRLGHEPLLLLLALALLRLSPVLVGLSPLRLHSLLHLLEWKKFLVYWVSILKDTNWLEFGLEKWLEIPF